MTNHRIASVCVIGLGELGDPVARRLRIKVERGEP